MPPNTRALITSARAAVKLLKWRFTPGIPFETTSNEVSSPKVCDKMRPAAPLAHECAEGYSGKGGVVMSGVQVESENVASFQSVSPSWIAVIGRHEL